MISITKNSLIIFFAASTLFLFAVQLWDAIGPDSCFSEKEPTLQTATIHSTKED